VLFELCWQLGVEHPDLLADRLTRPQLAGWIAWMQARPRGDRRRDVLMALQTAHLRGVWVEDEQHPNTFLPPWQQVQRAAEPRNEAEQLLHGFGASQRMTDM